jgi:Holliday junction DNA helicase RuvA
MISRLTGRLAHKSPELCVVDVGGVGYSVHTSLTTFGQLPDQSKDVSLEIHTYVREDQISLFGFATHEEKALFQRLIAISGVGPKTAVAILSGLPVDDLADAIAGGDHARLQAIPGVGRKTADRIILELKDRISKDLARTPSSKSSFANNTFDDALSALTNLGYRRQVAEAALRKVEISETAKIEEVIRSALLELNRA